MGEEDRGGLPDLDPDLSKNWGGLPDLDSPRLFWQISSKSWDKSRDKSRPISTLPDFWLQVGESRDSLDSPRLSPTFLELPRKFWKSGKGLPIFWQIGIGIGEASPIFWQIGIEIGEASPILLAHTCYLIGKDLYLQMIVINGWTTQLGIHIF